MQTLSQIRASIEGHILAYTAPKRPSNLYEPVSYILGQGGKRIRPLLCASGYLTGATEMHPRILDACLAMEVFHNFSLVHDDIMDEAPIRRGQATVHHRWNLATGILAGDVMLIDVFRLLQQAALSHQLEDVLKAFNRVAIGVCEGQQLDMDFENSQIVGWDTYLEMIYGKTAILLSGCLEIGGLLADVGDHEVEKLRRLGICLGLGFQLQDDWLDAFGAPEQTGKVPGGDILRNKKTALFVHAMQSGSREEQEELNYWYSGIAESDSHIKIKNVQRLFKQTGSAEAIDAAAQAYHSEADQIMESLGDKGPGKKLLRTLVATLNGRSS